MVTKDVVLEIDNLKIAGRLYLPDEGDQAPYATVGICHGIPARSPDPSDKGYPLLAERLKSRLG